MLNILDYSTIVSDTAIVDQVALAATFVICFSACLYVAHKEKQVTRANLHITMHLSHLNRLRSYPTVRTGLTYKNRFAATRNSEENSARVIGMCIWIDYITVLSRCCVAHPLLLCRCVFDVNFEAASPHKPEAGHHAGDDGELFTADNVNKLFLVGE